VGQQLLLVSRFPTLIVAIAAFYFNSKLVDFCLFTLPPGAAGAPEAAAGVAIAVDGGVDCCDPLRRHNK
jgi:hypothetical protein